MTKNKLLRITQINAAHLDKEIYNTFNTILRDAMKNLPPQITARCDLEISLLLKLALTYNSVVKSGSTFGQQLLSIKYNQISPTQKALYLISECLDYVRVKLDMWKPTHRINSTIFNIYVLIKMLEYVNLSMFLLSGEKPLLIDRVLGLQQVYAIENGQRQFGSKYLARELLWNGFIEILIYILPLINYHKMKRIVRSWNWMHKKPKRPVEERVMTVATKCTYCGENPISPYHMGCPHIFCYYCLKVSKCYLYVEQLFLTQNVNT
ncbi:unnamed protein product [Acanthoscelides obtectus]|uniref:RING-type E3 ubiquitin transferase (cysteine targeting) n=1 Tax=Acanthoscelides obtectus TaxID=200917 RepID=A0A9P0KVN8_ACAOB|nr:unnamed protein product [Acanthoscelides obtectus]CAK1664422.1 Peroxisome biogenesis factor 2 [Acanthoscelides obtectus]